MSLYGTMRTGVSGMNAQANRLGTVGDNIANASTAGYKKASTQFSSLILPSAGGAYNSGGVNTTIRYSISDQGTFSYTTSDTDLAINGRGFFIVEGTDGVEYLTRAGSFQQLSDGSLVNAAGFKLMGYPYQNGVDPTIVINGFDGLSEINLKASGMNAVPSTEGYTTANLPANAAVGDTEKTSLIAYDSQGNSRKLDYTYTKTADNEWELTVTYHDASVTPAVDINMLPTSPLTLEFNAVGELIVPAGGTFNTNPLPIGGANLSGLTIDISGMTQLGKPFSSTGDINGSGASSVIGYEISEDGIVSLKYESGELVPTYRIAVADVQSPDKLNPLAGNVYSQSQDSGVVVVGYPANGSYGSILSGALEDSNVDIAEELTGMIEAQRNYTANSKVFQTGSELLEVLVNLKR
ncbi:flagellar hook protein FlgE [Pseudorhizobium endolithicum]|uniref:Flagellar hook protein FlgE n=1 Tax=Pseudorhizobium endolithicum TaxID=1191678 RepID=A0ABM8PYK0_9HYPH|nr:flagellar hook protein FlgE [Pseudorhizobium endolithicum]CAD7054869.1 flagellar hook protein FlgE [Pseudorhizobium endolithicum]